MTSEGGDPKRALERERERIEGVLEASDAWRALRQLEQREAEGQPESAVDSSELRNGIAAELEGNRVFLAWRKISEAITLLGEPPARVDSATPASAPSVPPPVVLAPGAGSPSRLADRMVTIAAVTARATAPVAVLPPSSPSPHPSDDLTLIRGIDKPLAARLDGLGVRSFDAIARWTADDVRRVSAVLGLDRTIHRQNWIEQAALIAMRRRPPLEVQSAAAPSPPRHASEPARPIADLVAAAVRSILAKAKPLQYVFDGLAAPPSPAVSASQTLPPPAADDLTALRGVDDRVAVAMAEAGITTFAAIAAWSSADVQRLRNLLGPGAPVVRGQWIEQAAMLAAGQRTRYARTRALLSALPLAPRPAMTAIARDEGLACDLARLSQPAPAAVPDPEPLLPVERAPAGHAAPIAVAEAPPRLALQVVVSSPAPIHSEPRIAQSDAPKPARAPFALPLLVLAPVHAPPSPDPASRQPSATERLPADAAPPASPPPRAAHQPDPDPDPDPALADAVVDAGIDSDTYDSFDIDYDEVNLYNDATGGFGEANVQIVARATDNVAAPELEPRPLVYGSGAGTLQSRLRKAADPDDEFDARGYAAYRSAVEEASVEIVHRGGGTRTTAARPAAASVPSDGPVDARGDTGPDDVAPTTVRRFLKSLTGQDR